MKEKNFEIEKYSQFPSFPNSENMVIPRTKNPLEGSIFDATFVLILVRIWPSVSNGLFVIPDQLRGE